MRDDAGAAAAFEAIVPVLRHSRCIKCHSMEIFLDKEMIAIDTQCKSVVDQTGGALINVVECSSCHQGHNLLGLHMPPGASDRHLPSPAMPMIWEGLTDHQLCELFKDPQRSGMSSWSKRHNSARCSGLILITSHRTAHHYESPQAGIRSIPVIARRAVP